MLIQKGGNHYFTIVDKICHNCNNTVTVDIPLTEHKARSVIQMYRDYKPMCGNCGWEL